MSCDLSDPNIQEAYDEIVNGRETNWLILGYHDTRDKISLYSKGSGGLDELRNNLKEEVLYGFLRIENRFVLLTYVSEQVSGVRRARALVHGRAVGALFKAHQAQISASNVNDLSEASLRTRLKLDVDRPASPNRTPSPEEKSPSRPETPNEALSPASEVFEEASANAEDSERRDRERAEQQRQQREDVEKRQRAEAERLAREEAEQHARKEAEREANERRVREDSERRAKEIAEKKAREEAERRKQEALDQQLREKSALEAKAKAEAERKAREEADRKRTEELKTKFAELEKTGKVLLSGYVTVQGGGVYFWKRRFFELRGKTLFLYRDETDKLPISQLELDGAVASVQEAQSDVLILHSFKIDFKKSDPYYFFSDDKKSKELMMAAVTRYAS